MPDPQTGQNPQVKDPGFFVTSANIQTYAYTVDTLIRDINTRVLDREGKAGQPEISLTLHAKWVMFRIEWEKRFVDYKAPGWLSSGSDYDAIRGTHLEALRWKDKWALQGVDFAGMITPQPGEYNVTTADVFGGLSSALTWSAIVGAGVIAYMLMRRT